MNVKEAVAAAKNYIQDVFADEQISDVGLEEVEFEDVTDFWHITIGFSRPWHKTTTNNHPLKQQLALSQLMRETTLRRDYKVVTIKDSTGGIVSVKNRELQAAA
ncbi:MAG TPA: hypothetical protein VGB77_17835 [Abditibacteriaceae bacterium]|jgi:hypothetical protein